MSFQCFFNVFLTSFNLPMFLQRSCKIFSMSFQRFFYVLPMSLQCFFNQHLLVLALWFLQLVLVLLEIQLVRLFLVFLAMPFQHLSNVFPMSIQHHFNVFCTLFVAVGHENASKIPDLTCRG